MLTIVAKTLIAITTSLGTMAVLSVILRFHCRLKVQKVAVGADDWCILIALILYIALAVQTASVAAITEIGDHLVSDAYDQIVFSLKTGISFQIFQVLCIGIAKISVLLFYKKIFIFEVFQIITNVLIGIIVAFDFSIIMAFLFSKGLPVSKLWDPVAPFKIEAFGLLEAFCAGNAALDIMTLTIPLSVIRNLHVSASKKLHLSVIFTLGSSCIAVSIARLYFAVKLQTTESNFWTAFLTDMLWALVEPPIFILTACLLTLGPMLRGKYGPVNLCSFLGKKLRLSTEHTSTKQKPGIPMNNSYTPAQGSTESTCTVRLPLYEQTSIW